MSSFAPPKFYGNPAVRSIEATPTAPPTVSSEERARLTRRNSVRTTPAEKAAYAATEPAPLARPAATPPKRPRPNRQMSTPGTKGERDALLRHNFAPLAPAAATNPHLAEGLQAPAQQAHSPLPAPANAAGAAETDAAPPPSFIEGAAHVSGDEKVGAGTEAKGADATSLDPAKLHDDYLWALGVLAQRTAFARKVMPRVMQSAGIGLVLAGALHNPLLLLLAPALYASGAVLAAPLGWVLAKFFQHRAQNNQAVKNALEVIAVHDDALKQVKRRVTEDLAAGKPAAKADRALLKVKDKVLQDDPKLAHAEAFAKGDGKPFETGLRNAFVGPFKFWRKQFDRTLDDLEGAIDKRRKAAAESAAEAKARGTADNDGPAVAGVNETWSAEK